jgi:hypothetical protein
MTISEDAEGLLDALYAMNQELGKRPSIQQAKLSFFPEWDKHRLFEAAKALDAAGDILNLTGAMMNVDLSSTAQKRAKARTLPPQNPATTIHIGENYNSPIQQISAGAHGTQATTYTITNSQLRAAIDTYKKHADELRVRLRNVSHGPHGAKAGFPWQRGSWLRTRRGGFRSRARACASASSSRRSVRRPSAAAAP